MRALQKVFLAIFLTTGTAAFADPTTLVCDEKGTSQVYTFDGAVTLDLDETQRTVTVHYPGVTGTVPVFHQEAHTVGPMTGTFTPDEISFPIPGTVVTISRVTGEAVIRTDGGQTMAESWNCRVGKKQF